MRQVLVNFLCLPPVNGIRFGDRIRLCPPRSTRRPPGSVAEFRLYSLKELEALPSIKVRKLRSLIREGHLKGGRASGGSNYRQVSGSDA